MGSVMALTFAVSATISAMFHSTLKKTSGELEKLSAATERVNSLKSAYNQAFNSGAIAAGQYVTQMNAVYSKINQLSQATKEYNDIARSKRSAWRGLAEDYAKFYSVKSVAGTAFSPLKDAVSTAIDFEAVMSKVGAITGASDTNMKELSAKARELGASTQYTASQVGEAMTYLGMAGWKTGEITEGLQGLLSLAAASGTDLASAADIVSDNLTAFGLAAGDASRMADVYARTITSTNTSIGMLGETMKYAAPVAHAFGATMEETSAMAGLMANAGIKASQAGTALRAGFLRLAAPTAKANKAMAELGIDSSEAAREQAEAASALEALGIQLTDVSGKERKMGLIIRELAEKTKDLGKEEKLARLQAIFGTTAASGWLAVINQGPEAFNKLTGSLEGSRGAADEMAKRMRNNANGSLTAMKSALEAVAISVGSAFLPQIQASANAVSSLSSGFAKWAGENAFLISTIGELATGIAAGVVATRGWIVLQGAWNLVTTSTIALHKSYVVWMTMQEMIQGRLSTGMKIMTALQWAWNTAMSANPIGAMIVLGMALAGVVGLIYDNFTSVKTAWDNWFSALKVSSPVIAGIIEGIAAVLLAPYRIICALVDKVKELMGFGPVPVSTGSGMQAIRENARGGIYNKGAFLTTFAEDGPEAAIPLDGSPRAVGLWQRAGEILGQRSSSGGEYNISIPITVNGSADSSTVQNIAGQVEEAVRRALANIQHQERRLSFA